MPADDPRLAALSALVPHTDVLLGLYEDGHGVHNYNSAIYLDASGVVHTHRKLYLPTYDVFEERKHFSPGQSMRAFARNSKSRSPQAQSRKKFEISRKLNRLESTWRAIADRITHTTRPYPPSGFTPAMTTIRIATRT